MAYATESKIAKNRIPCGIDKDVALVQQKYVSSMSLGQTWGARLTG